MAALIVVYLSLPALFGCGGGGSGAGGPAAGFSLKVVDRVNILLVKPSRLADIRLLPSVAGEAGIVME